MTYYVYENLLRAGTAHRAFEALAALLKASTCRRRARPRGAERLAQLHRALRLCAAARLLDARAAGDLRSADQKELADVGRDCCDDSHLRAPSRAEVFAFHRSACGMAINMNQKTEINYVPEKTSFLVNSMFSAGAVAIDDEGIVKITCEE